MKTPSPERIDVFACQTDNRPIIKTKQEMGKAVFFSMFAHDLKNPITAAIGSIDITREGRLGPINEEQAEYLQSAIDSCNEVVAMIDNLLDMQRFDAGAMPLSIQNCQVEEIVHEVAGKYIRMAAYERISLIYELEADLPLVTGDRFLLGRVIANLLANAIKFTPEEGRIVLSCRYVEDSDAQLLVIPDYCRIPEGFSAKRPLMQLSIMDSGEGIPPDELAIIFEQFAQGNNSPLRGQRGAGLGLAFCRMAMEQMGGVIWGESNSVVGSEFIALLPCQTKGYQQGVS